MSEASVLSLVAEGRRVLAEERARLLSGRHAGLGELAARKSELLAALEAAVPLSPATEAAEAALAALVADSRRNERLIAAAKAGIAAARRRIAAIEATRRGDVAYDADGSRIVSRDDAQGKTSRA